MVLSWKHARVAITVAAAATLTPATQGCHANPFDQGGSCSALKGSCASDSDCCDGLHCDGHECESGAGTTSSSCKSPGGSCTYGSDCCGASTCSGGICRSSACGSSSSSSCDVDSDCCSGTCSSSGRCNVGGSTACAKGGASCVYDRDCCSDNCLSNGTCASSVSTGGATAGGSCSGAPFTGCDASTGEFLYCNGGLWVDAKGNCNGVGGACHTTTSGDAWSCGTSNGDLTYGLSGGRCASSNNAACAFDGRTVLWCNGSTWYVKQQCSTSCAVSYDSSAGAYVMGCR